MRTKLFCAVITAMLSLFYQNVIGQQIYMSASANANGSNLCSTGPIDIILEVFYEVGASGNEAPFSFSFVFSSPGNPGQSRNFTSQQGYGSFIQNYQLNGPGTHNITINCNATSGIGKTYGGSQVVTFSYGPSSCNKISGRLFIDKNGDCIFDSSDVSLANMPIVNNYSQKVVNTQVDGKYDFYLPDGPYSFSVPNVAPSGANTYNPLKCPVNNTSSGNLTNDLEVNFAYQDSAVNSNTTTAEISTYNMSGSPCAVPSSHLFLVQLSTNAPSREMTINFGDGTDTSYVRHRWQSVDTIYHVYNTAGAFNVQASCTLEDTVIKMTPDEPVTIPGNCANVSGVVFFDKNGNCNYDSLVDGIKTNSWVFCKVGNQTYSTQVDSLGRYSFQMAPSTAYEVSLGGLDSNGYMHYYNYGVEACVKRYQKSQPETGLNFGLKCTPQEQDFEVRSFEGLYRPGRSAFFNVIVSNKDCQKANGTLSLTLDDEETFTYSTVAPTRVNGKVIEWDFEQIGAENYFSTYVTVFIDSNAVMTDTVCHYLLATPLAGDGDSSNNELTICTPMRASWDPNDKMVFSAKTGQEAGSIFPKDNELVYQLRFQNMGTDTAFNIYLLDTLDANLNLKTFHVISSSHSMKTYISPSRVARFEFSNINLPDDKVNEPLSHGYVLYGITPNENLPIGTKIHNTGYIYFDFNQPVVTNTTETIIVVDNTSVGELKKNTLFTIYPNPANKQVNIALKEGNSEADVELLDVFGKVIHAQHIVNSGSLSVSDLSSGMYLIKVNVKGEISTTKVMVTK